MARLIDADSLKEVLVIYLKAPHVNCGNNFSKGMRTAIQSCIELLDSERAVIERLGAYEDEMDSQSNPAEDKKLLKAIRMLKKQYGHSKQSDYVRDPVGHALYHTWRNWEGRKSDG